MLQGFYLMAHRAQRKRQLILWLTLALTLLMLLLALFSRAGSAPAPALPVSAPHYTAAVRENRLIILQGGKTVLQTAIDTRTLPEADQRALENGIPLADAEALARLLEDYGS